MCFRIRNSISLVESGCHVIIAVSNCPSAVALLSWGETHGIPLVLLPTELCNQIDRSRPQIISKSEATKTTITMGGAMSELQFPAFALANMLEFNRIVLIMDDFHYARLYIETNAVNSLFKSRSSFFVYRMDEVTSFFEKDANIAGHDNFVVLGNHKSCHRFFSNGNRQSPILKIKYMWIVSCTGLTTENFQLLRSTMANIYLITSQNDLSQGFMHRIRPSLTNITRTIGESFSAMKSRLQTQIPIQFQTSDSSSAEISDAATWQQGVELISKIKTHYQREEHTDHEHRNIFNVYHRNIEFRNWTKVG